MAPTRQWCASRHALYRSGTGPHANHRATPFPQRSPGYPGRFACILHKLRRPLGPWRSCLVAPSGAAERGADMLVAEIETALDTSGQTAQSHSEFARVDSARRAPSDRRLAARI